MIVAQLASVVIPGLPQHMTHCGNHRRQTCFDDGEYVEYLSAF
jgi:hypothetical protein